MIRVEFQGLNHPNETESQLGFTEKEFNLWADPFWHGQSIFDRHLKNTDKLTPLHIIRSYNGIENKIMYIEELDLIYVCIEYISKIVTLEKKHHQEMNTFRTTNLHLIRLGLCTRLDVLPIFTGIEERAHAYFHKHIKKTLKPEDIIYTSKHDGSDTSEEYAFNQIASIILNNTDLPLFPLPSNFQHEYRLASRL